MPKVEQIAGLRTILTGGADRNGGGDGPLVCLLHGYGANGQDLAGLWRVLDVPRETRFAFPEAPVSLAGVFGFPAACWWHIDVQRFIESAASGIGLEQHYDEEPEGLAAARDHVVRWLDELTARLQVPRGRVVLGGFSQGAMLSADVALHAQEGPAFAGLVLLSGALINRQRWAPLLPGAPRTPRFQSHGLVDDILPFEAGLALHQFLGAGPFPGELRRFYGRHEIPPDVLNDLGAWLTARLQPAQTG